MKMKFMKNRRQEQPHMAEPLGRHQPTIQPMEAFHGHHPAGPLHRHNPTPPHLRKRFYLEFEEDDWEIFVKVFGDEDSADAAIQVIQNAPPEIGVLAMQAVEMIRRAESC